MGLDQAAADRQAEARAGCLLVAGAHAVEHVEHRVARFGRDAGPSSLTRTLTRSPSERRCDLDPTTGRRVFGGVVENVDQHLLDEDRVDVEDRHVGRDLHLDLQGGERPRHLLERPADDLAQIDPFAVRLQRAVAEPGHVEQVLDEAVQPLALLEDGLHELRAVGIGQRAVTARQPGRRADDRDQRRTQIVRHRREQRRAQALGLGQQPRLLDVGREVGALDRDRDLIDQRFQQVPLLRRQLRASGSRTRRRAGRPARARS